MNKLIDIFEQMSPDARRAFVAQYNELHPASMQLRLSPVLEIRRILSQIGWHTNRLQRQLSKRRTPADPQVLLTIRADIEGLTAELVDVISKAVPK